MHRNHRGHSVHCGPGPGPGPGPEPGPGPGPGPGPDLRPGARSAHTSSSK